MADLDQVKLAAQAYIYGYPLVYNLTELAKFPAGTSLLGIISRDEKVRDAIRHQMPLLQRHPTTQAAADAEAIAIALLA